MILHCGLILYMDELNNLFHFSFNLNLKRHNICTNSSNIISFI